MPVKRLPASPSLDHLKHQAKDLLKMQAARDIQAAQLIREFHPHFKQATDEQIFDTPLTLADAQFTLSREYGFQNWTRLKAHIQRPTVVNNMTLPHHERIDDAIFRRAVVLLDAGNEAEL